MHTDEQTNTKTDRYKDKHIDRQSYRHMNNKLIDCTNYWLSNWQTTRLTNWKKGRNIMGKQAMARKYIQTEKINGCSVFPHINVLFLISTHTLWANKQKANFDLDRGCVLTDTGALQRQLFPYRADAVTLKISPSAIYIPHKNKPGNQSFRSSEKKTC